MAAYVPFTRKQFDDLMRPMGFATVDLPSEAQFVYEGVVRTTSRTYPYVVRVYSSIDRATEMTSPVNAAAIHIGLYYIQKSANLRAVGEPVSIARVGNSFTRVRQVCRQMFERVRDGLCPTCGLGIMVVRVNSRRNPFRGCSRYPVCRATMPAHRETRLPMRAAQRVIEYRGGLQ